MQNNGHVIRTLSLAMFCLLFVGLIVWFELTGNKDTKSEDQAIKIEDHLADVDLTHGKRQVAQMLSDLPAMAAYTTAKGETKRVTEKDRIWQWAATRFGQKINGSSVEWDNHVAQDHREFIAEHTSPWQGSKGLIRIRTFYEDEDGKIRRATFDELWSSCVFELINIQNTSAFLDVEDRALNGELSRDEWVRMVTQLEHRAVLKTANFCREVWIPWSEQHGHKYDKVAWHLDAPSDYDEWIQQYQQSADDPYLKVYADEYDNYIVPYQKR